jgi:ABC-type multidrug transport system fused ATPase/permease subunit
VARVESVDPKQGARSGDRRARRHEPDELAADDLGPARLRLRSDPRDDLVQRGCLPVGHVHAHLDEARPRQFEPERPHAREAAVALANEPRDLARDPDIGRPQVHVERDQGPTNADDRGACARVEPGRAPVGDELARVDAPLELLGAAAPVEGGLAAVLGQPSVEEDREPELVGEPVGEEERSRPRAVLVLGPERHDRDDVRHSDPRVGSLVGAEVDEIDGRANACDERRDELLAEADERVDGAMVVGVDVYVEQPSRLRHRASEAHEDALVATLGDVRHRLERERHRARIRRPAGRQTTRGARVARGTAEFGVRGRVGDTPPGKSPSRAGDVAPTRADPGRRAGGTGALESSLNLVVANSSPPFRRTFVRLLGFLRPYRWSLVASVVLAVGSQVAGLAIPWLTGYAIDHALPGEDGRLLAIVVGLVVLAGTAKAAMLVARRFIAGRQALGVEFDLRNALYSRLLRLSWGFYDRHQTGQLMSRATVDLQSVRFFLGYGLIFFFQHVMTVVTVTAILLVIDWKLALVALAITPILCVSAFLYSRRSHPILKDVQQRLADLTTVAEENIVGVNVVKAFAQEPREEAKFANRNEALFDVSRQALRQRALYTPLMSFLPLLAQAAVLLAGGRRVVDGDLSLGAFVAFNVYLLMLVWPLRMLGYWINEFQRTVASGERIFEVLDEPEEITERPGARPLPAGGGELRFEGVTFGYDPARPVLEDVNLEIEPGTTVALIGHTGSGKTTLTALVPRFYDVTDGRVLLDGLDVRDATIADLRRAVGLVSQDPFLFSATVRENIAFGALDATNEDVERAARMAQAHDFIAALPNGYDTVIGERGITLSGGQRQRIAIARAILVDPRVLVLDDATASVDATTEARIRLGLREAMRGRTTLIIAHRLSTISLADEVVVLEHGRIVARGTRDELAETSPVYREIVEHGLVEARVLTEAEEATA